ncbi:hypothetical protein IM25_15020 [Rhodococcus sp. p52]|nr:hypothetical protein IM25_15020 [Rhodococcus sp. p52]
MRALSPATARLEIVIEELIRISPCRRGCCEALDSTHPDTQGRGRCTCGGGSTTVQRVTVVVMSTSKYYGLMTDPVDDETCGRRCDLQGGHGG